MALTTVDKRECYKDAVKITEAYAGASGSHENKLFFDELLGKLYKKLCELSEDIEG
jgi:hypothetical protein